MKLIAKIGAIVSTLVLLLGLTSVIATADVDPDYVYYELEPGESVEVVKTVTTPTLAPKADVVIAMDLTGSMGGELTNLKSEVSNIITALAAESTDLNVGIVSFMDYPGYYSYGGYSSTYGSASYGDYAFSVDYPVGNDFAAADAAVSAMSLGYGADGPEAYTRVMWETGQPDSGIGFRAGAQRIVVMFGDNVPHDLGPGVPWYGNSGIDPGRDATAGTADDIDVEDTAIPAMLAAGVTLIYVDSSGYTDWYTGNYIPGVPFNYWDNIATQTGGSAVGINSNGTIPGGISLTDLILGQIEEITPDVWWEVTADTGLNISLDPSVYYDVAGGTGLEFTETISLDEGDYEGATLSATVTFYSGIYESGTGAVIGTQTIEVLTPEDNEPPIVWCMEGPNPHGKNIPPAGWSTLPGSKGGKNDDGFYYLYAEDDSTPVEDLPIYVGLANYDPEAGVFEPYWALGWDPSTPDIPPTVSLRSGDVIKVTEALGAKPSYKKIGSIKGQAGAVTYHITVPNDQDLVIVAVDANGDMAISQCILVPPPPK